MPAPAVALDYLNTTTRNRVVPFLVDQVTKTNTTFLTLNQAAVFLDGGDYISQPIMTGIPSDMVMSYTGTEIFPANTQVDEQGAVFDWKFYGISIDLTGPDEARNSGIAGLINLLKIRTQKAEIALRDRLGQDLQGDGTTHGGKDLVGWAASIDDGGVVPTYGGVSRSAYPCWAAQVLGNSSVPRKFTTALIDSGITAAAMDSDAPNLFITTPGIVQRLNQLLMPIQRSERTDYISGGIRNVGYRGYPVISDQQIATSPSETFYGLNTRYIQLYYHKDRHFRWVPFQRQGNQDVVTGKILLALCIVVSRPASQFKIIDLDSSLS